MKRILLLLCTSILLPSHVMGQGGIGPGRAWRPDPQSWERYTVKDEEFSVTLPAPPAMTTVKASETPAQKPRQQRQLKTSQGGVLYMIDVFENPKPRQSLKDFVAAQNANSTLDLTTERDLTINGFAGKEYSSHIKTPLTTVQFFATENRLITFAARGAAPDDPGVKQFFSSIRLGKEQTGIEVPAHRLDVNGERVYTSKELDVKPRILTKPEPNYTEDARANHISGVVILRALLSKTGQVTNIRVVAGLPYGLTERAIAAARKLQFVPGMKDGEPASMWIQLEYHFEP